MTKMPGHAVWHDFESSTANRYHVYIENDDTGRAILQPINRDGGNTEVNLTFRSGLYADISGKPYRWSRVCHDATFAGVDLPATLT